MTSKRIAQTNQQQKSEKPQGSGILQRAAVRPVSDAGMQSTDDREEVALSNSTFSKDFSRVPISTTKPQQFQAINLQSHPVQPIQAKMTQGKGEMTGDRQVSSEAQHPNKTGLPDRLKAGIENLSGYPMDDVQVHYNSPKPAQLNALAYTQGTEIHVASGQEQHLPHEVGHLVQQMQGRVKPTIRIKGVSINNDENLEREADVMGTKALQMKNKMRERVDQPKKATTGSFSLPSLTQQSHGFAKESTNSSPQAVPLVQPLNQPLTHDISRIPLRSPQANIIQRVDYSKNRDNEIEYTPGKSELELNKQVRISKPKNLYQEKNKSDKLGEILKNQLVKVLQEEKSWVKIKTTDGLQGWINTKDSLNDRSASFGHKSGRVIMQQNPTVDDVKQNMFGDCFLLSALMSLTSKNPDYIIKKLFVTDPKQESDTHTVRFFKIETEMDINSSTGTGFRYEFTPEEVTVKNTLLQTTKQIADPKTQKLVEPGNVGSNGRQPWPALIEKAFAQWQGKQGNDTLQGGQGFRAAMYLMGEEYRNLQIEMPKGKLTEQQKNDISLNKQSIINAHQDPQHIVTAATQQEVPEKWKQDNKSQKDQKNEYKWGGITFQHEYEVVSADNNRIQLRNPNGRYSRINQKPEPNQAVSTISWEDFFIVFDTVVLRRQ